MFLLKKPLFGKKSFSWRSVQGSGKVLKGFSAQSSIHQHHISTKVPKFNTDQTDRSHTRV